MISPVLLVASGACLVAIQARHTKGVSLLQKPVRDEIRKPLDKVDKRLAAAAGVLFVAFLASLALAADLQP